MVAAFVERGRFREAADKLRSHGFPFVVETGNWVLRVGLRHTGCCFAHAREAFDGIALAAGGVRPDERSFRALVLGCCREGAVRVRSSRCSTMATDLLTRC